MLTSAFFFLLKLSEKRSPLAFLLPAPSQEGYTLTKCKYFSPNNSDLRNKFQEPLPNMAAGGKGRRRGEDASQFAERASALP